jgi:hypothetical protein
MKASGVAETKEVPCRSPAKTKENIDKRGAILSISDFKSQN